MTAHNQPVEVRKQSYKCEGRGVEEGCPIFEQYFYNLVACLNNAEAGILPESGGYDFPDDLVEVYRALPGLEEEDQRRAQLDLRTIATREFRQAGFCPQAGSRTPHELSSNGQAGTCHWLNWRLAQNVARRVTPVG